MSVYKMETSWTFAKCLISTPVPICLTMPDVRSPQKKSFITTKEHPVWKDCQITSRGAICWDCQGTTIFRWTEIKTMWVKSEMVSCRIVKICRQKKKKHVVPVKDNQFRKTRDDGKFNLTRNAYIARFYKTSGLLPTTYQHIWPPSHSKFHLPGKSSLMIHWGEIQDRI